MFPPLYIKYQTKSGKYYLYDCDTGRIIEVDEVIYAIIDDFRVLTCEELLVKYESLGRDRVSLACRELDELRQKGLLVDHVPRELGKIELVKYDDRVRPLGEFWKDTAMLLILGITEKCNLNCSYCCYSGHFVGQRTHSQRSMSWETAQQAIKYYIEHDQAGDGSCPISFYGGEPLLEFPLIKKCVDYATEKAKELGKTPRFAISTNGTLLSDEVCDYLVEHEFLVMVSLDGPKVSHDRYRVYPNGEGSFDKVERNLYRFAERYPDYKMRGLNMTITPPLDWEERAGFIAKLYLDYPLTRAGLVNTDTGHEVQNDAVSPDQHGCSSSHVCQRTIDPEPKECFWNFSKEDSAKLLQMWESCMESITQVGVMASYERMPFAMMLFEGQIMPYHRRMISKQAPAKYFFVPCLPGFTRRFVDVEGNYRVCERVDHTDAYVLGNVRDGLDVSRLEQTMERRRQFGDCANCDAMKTCDICYARISNPERPRNGTGSDCNRLCERTRQATRTLLRIYTEIMEVNPKAFDRPVSEDYSLFKKLHFGERESGPVKPA